MSYDLNLWKQGKGFRGSAAAVYHRLCNGEVVDGLEDLPVNQLLERLREDFPGIEQNRGTLDWEAPGDGGALQVCWSRQWVRFDCYRLPVPDVNRLVALARAFGIPVYDPQQDRRYETLPTGEEKPPEH